jgi:prefoldin subunit 5
MSRVEWEERMIGYTTQRNNIQKEVRDISESIDEITRTIKEKKRTSSILDTSSKSCGKLETTMVQFGTGVKNF